MRTRPAVTYVSRKGLPREVHRTGPFPTELEAISARRRGNGAGRKQPTPSLSNRSGSQRSVQPCQTGRKRGVRAAAIRSFGGATAKSQQQLQLHFDVSSISQGRPQPFSPLLAAACQKPLNSIVCTGPIFGCSGEVPRTVGRSRKAPGLEVLWEPRLLHVGNPSMRSRERNSRTLSWWNHFLQHLFFCGTIHRGNRTVVALAYSKFQLLHFHRIRQHGPTWEARPCECLIFF